MNKQKNTAAAEDRDGKEMLWRRFSLISKNQDEIKAFERLCGSKKLAREDLILILKCIKLNEQCLGI